MNMFKKNGGFTLVELIVVIAILAILAGIAVPAYSGYIAKAQAAGDQTTLAAVKTAVMAANATKGTVATITFTEGEGVTAVTLVTGSTGTAVADNNKIKDFYGSDLTKIVLESGSSATWKATGDNAGWTINP